MIVDVISQLTISRSMKQLTISFIKSTLFLYYMNQY